MVNKIYSCGYPFCKIHRYSDVLAIARLEGNNFIWIDLDLWIIFQINLPLVGVWQDDIHELPAGGIREGVQGCSLPGRLRQRDVEP